MAAARSILGPTLRDALHTAHWMLDGTMADVTDEIANRPVAGTANLIGASYMHVLLSEDHLINRPQVRDTRPLCSTTWSGRTGADKLEPEKREDMAEWFRTVRVDMAKAREYAKAVFAMSEAFVGGLTDEELEREGELGPFGRSTLAGWIDIIITGHCQALMGEISAIKGTFGLKGYPF